MMTCDSFRTHFEAGTNEPEFLAHLRTCDRCLDFAAHQDPDVMFRALSTDEMIPPGGVEAFVSGVMQQVRVREAEKTAIPQRAAAWPRRLAMAAAIAMAVFGTTFVDRTDVQLDATGVQRAQLRAPLITKPVIASYESDNATIVEVPAEAGDVQIVMVFDENLPADL